MKKILILYATYGGGHLSAAKSVKQYLDEHYTNIQTEMVDCVEYINKSLNKVTTGAYKEIAKNAPWAWKQIYQHSEKGSLSKISMTTNKFMALKLLKLFHEFNPDLVVSTHPFATQMTGYLKKKKKVNCKLATLMTDFMPHEQWLVRNEFSDFFFVSNFNMKSLLMKEKINKDKIFVTGIPVSPKFQQEFNKEAIFSEFGLQHNRKTVLFFGGGGLGIGKESTVKILKSFLELDQPLQVIAISGKNSKMKKHFDELAEIYGADNLKVLEFTDKVPELMSISDLVVTKPGGLTTSESLVSELPMIIINPIPGQEEQNAQFLETAGIAIWIKKHDDPSIILKDLLNSPIRLTEMRENAKIMGKRNSTQRICNILINSLN